MWGDPEVNPKSSWTKPKRLGLIKIGVDQMPTVLRKDGFQVRIYPNDHQPAHVHVFKADGEVKINIAIEVKVIEVAGRISNKDVSKAIELVTQYQQTLLAKWREIHE